MLGSAISLLDLKQEFPASQAQMAILHCRVLTVTFVDVAEVDA
jgi:hypothetical protein